MPLPLIVFALVAIWLAYDWWSRRQAFRLAGVRLGLEHFVSDSSSFSGARDGVHVHVEHVGGKGEHMDVTVAFAPCALLLSLRRATTAELSAVERGEAVDLTTGDEAFDQPWIVEGAPAPRVLRLLSDKDLRERLTQFSGIGGATITIEDGKLTLHRAGSDYRRGELDTPRIELAIDLALAVVKESCMAPEPGDMATEPADYRSAPVALDDGPAKIAALRTLRAERRIREIRPLVAYLSAAAPLLLLFLQHGRHPEIPFLLMAGGMPLIATGSLLREYFAARRLARDTSLGAVVWIWMAVCWGALVYIALR